MKEHLWILQGVRKKINCTSLIRIPSCREFPPRWDDTAGGTCTQMIRNWSFRYLFNIVYNIKFTLIFVFKWFCRLFAKNCWCRVPCIFFTLVSSTFKSSNKPSEFQDHWFAREVWFASSSIPRFSLYRLRHELLYQMRHHQAKAHKS